MKKSCWWKIAERIQSTLNQNLLNLTYLLWLKFIARSKCFKIRLSLLNQFKFAKFKTISIKNNVEPQASLMTLAWIFEWHFMPSSKLTPWRVRRQRGHRSKIQVGIIPDEKELFNFFRNMKRKLTVLALNWRQRIRNLVTKVTFSIVCWRHRTPNLVISRRCFTKVGKQMKMHVRACRACWNHSFVH